jgi:hypothetical protein
MEENKINQELTTEEVKLQITEIIEEAKKSREVARLASKSGELKRNPFQSLDEKGMLNADSLASEFDVIQAKKSTLSSGERQVIQQIVWMALRKAALKKAQETAQAKVEAQEKETSIPKKPRTRKKKSEKSDSDK